MEEKKVLVSIIVPVYNSAKYLRKCIESLINQSLRGIEIICINDGSTDDSQKILDEYASEDERIVVINQENRGISYCRNAGIKLARGEYIGFVDSDDWVDLYFYENLYNSANWFKADIAAAGIIRLNRFHRKFHIRYDKVSITDDTNLKFKLCNIPKISYVWNKIYRTSSLRSSCVEFEEGIIYEDVMFTIKILYSLKTLVTVPETYYYYNRHSGSLVSRRDKKAREDSVYVRNQVEQFFLTHDVDSSCRIKTHRYKLFGLTIFKKQLCNGRLTYILFNIFKLRL